MAHAGAAITLQAGAKKAEIGHGLDQFARKSAVAVALLDDRDQIFFNESARGVAHQTLVVGEQGIKLDEIHALELKSGHILLFGWADVSPDSGTLILRAKPAQGRLSKLAEPTDRVKRAMLSFELWARPTCAESTTQVQKIALL